MFLNNLKNKLQPHAIPVLVKNDNESLESNENNASCALLPYIVSSEKHVNLCEIENISISGECDIKSNHNKQQCKTEFSDKELQSVSVNNHELVINEQCEHEQVDSMVHQQHQYTQTEQTLFNHFPRKTILRGRISVLHREVRKLKQQLERQKNNINVCKKDILERLL